MKKIILIIFAVSTFLTGNCDSQWVKQTSNTSSFLLDVHFVNQNTGWTCGFNGTILKTTDGGNNWLNQSSGVNKSLFGIYAVDSNVVYSVGWFETILKTTNGGTNWQILRNGAEGTTKSFFGLYFLNQNTGWMLANNYILRTTNGGSTFDSTYTIYSYLEDVYFKDSLNGVLCGDGSLIMKSADGGITWNVITIPRYNFEQPDFLKLSFMGNTGWVIGAGTDAPGLGPLVYKTTNLGAVWDTIGRVPYPQGTQAYCVFFSSLNTGWTGGSFGHLYKTTNGGISWGEQVVGGGYKNSIFFYNDYTGWVVGADTGSGLIAYTNSGGMYVSVSQISSKIPDQFELFQNYPNPFNPATKIKFSVSQYSEIKLIVYDVTGREISRIVDEFMKPGEYTAEYNAGSLSSGVYFYRLIADGSFIESKRMVVLK